MAIVDPKIDDFTVDVPNRTVSHPCGVTWSWHKYTTVEDWEKSDPIVTNPQLIPGNQVEFAMVAKYAAKRAGMHYC